MIKFGFNDRLLFEKYFDEFSKTVSVPKSRFSYLTCSNVNTSSKTFKSNDNNCKMIIKPEQNRKKKKNSCGGFFGCF